MQSSIWLCLAVLPGVTALDTGSIAGIAAGSTVAFILTIAIVIMCALIMTKSSTPSSERISQPSRFSRMTRNGPRGTDIALAPAPNTISYGQPAYAASVATTRTPSLLGVGTPIPFSGSSMLGVPDPSLGVGNGVFNAMEQLQVQETAVPLEYNTYL